MAEIRSALSTNDKCLAVDRLCEIPDWHPPMASAVLAACKPESYTVVDAYALRTRLRVQGYSASQVRRISQFTRQSWEPHLEFCQELASASTSRSGQLTGRFGPATGGRPASSGWSDEAHQGPKGLGSVPETPDVFRSFAGFRSPPSSA